MSLLSSALDGLSPELVSRVAVGLGAPQGAVEKGARAAVPAILAAILGATRSDDGLAALTRALSQGSSQSESDFTSMLGAGFRDVSDAGGETLSTLIGGGQMAVLASKLRDFAGLPEGSAGALLGAVNSVLMRTLGSTARDRGLDGRALVAALDGEKEAIARALPSDFARTLEGAGLLDAVAGPLRAARPDPVITPMRAAEPRPVEPRPSAAVRSEPVQPAGRPWWNWVAGLAALAALLWLASTLLRGTPDKAVVTEAVKDSVAVPDGTALAATATGLVDRLGTALQGVTDEASARAAAPVLGAIKDELTGLQTSFGALPAEGRSAVKGVVTAALPAIKSAADRLLGETGIAAILNPALGDITKLLSGF